MNTPKLCPQCAAGNRHALYALFYAPPGEYQCEHCKRQFSVRHEPAVALGDPTNDGPWTATEGAEQPM